MILFLHWLGICLWLGASLSFMVWGPASKRVGLEAWAHVWDTLAKVQRWIVAPGAALATISGIVLSMQYAQRGLSMGARWLVIMQSLGLLAGLLTLAVATSLVNRMAYLAARSLEAGQQDPRAETVRKRLAVVGSVAGGFVVVALYFTATRAQ